MHFSDEPEENYTDQFLRSLDDDHLLELVATFPPEDVEPSSQRDLLVRISAEMERRRQPGTAG
jgi:hypothetical protein